MADKKEKSEQKLEGKPVRVVWGTGEGLPLIYSNQLLVTHGSETEFHLVFGQLSPPLTHGFVEEELPDKVEIKPVVKIVITPEVMRKIVEALAVNLEKYELKKEDNDGNS